MKSSSIAEIKKELQFCSKDEIKGLVHRLARFKKENKELLTYLLFEANDENGHIEKVKEYMDLQFAEINTSSYYFIKKSVRKILSEVKKQIRFSQNKESEISLLLYFCSKLKAMNPSYSQNLVLSNTYNNQLRMIRTKLSKLHEDLQFDYQQELKDL